MKLNEAMRQNTAAEIANWTAPGFVGQMFKAIAKHIAPSGMPSPLLWGDEPAVRERLKNGIASLECSRHLYELSYPFSPADVVEFFRANYGPMTRAFASIGAEAQQQLGDELTDLWSRHNRATDGTTKVDAEYLQVIAVRGSRDSCGAAPPSRAGRPRPAFFGSGSAALWGSLSSCGPIANRPLRAYGAPNFRKMHRGVSLFRLPPLF
jgi:hypothetical protein